MDADKLGRTTLDTYLREVAEAVDEILGGSTPELASAHLTAAKEIVRSGGYAELSVYFYGSAHEVVDALESDILREGRPVASIAEVREWLKEGVQAVIDDTR